MSWERRKNNWYYTRSRRVNGRVVRTYFGRGPEAEKAAEEDVQRREKLKQERRKWELKRAKRAKLEALIDAYDRLVDVVLRVEMRCRGYHFHRGEWRKRRGFERMMAEREAARREREQQAAAAETQGPAKRRSVPPDRQRECGQGLVRSLKNGPVMTRLRERSSAAPCRTRDLSAGRRRGPTVVISLREMLRLAERDVYNGSAARPPPRLGMRVNASTERVQPCHRSRYAPAPCFFSPQSVQWPPSEAFRPKSGASPRRANRNVV